MNYKLRLLIADIIGVMQRFLVAYCVITVFLYQTDTSAPLYNLGLIPIPFLSYLIERKAKHIWSFVLLHCALLPVYLIAAYSLDSAVFYSLYIILTTVVAYYMKNNRNESNIFYMIFVFLIFYMGSAAAKMLFLAHMTFYLAILFVLLHYLRQYLNNFARYFQAHSSVANIPYRQIRNTNNALMIFLGLFCAFIILPSSGLQLNALLLKCAKALLQLIIFIISFFMRDDSDPGSAATGMSVGGLTAAKTSPLLQLIFRIIEWLLLTLFFVVILLLITWCIYKLYQYFYRRSRNEIMDRVEFISPFTKKEASKKASPRIGIKRFGHSNQAAIRKYYYQAISSSVDSSTYLQKDLTPSDLTGLIKSQGLGDTPDSSVEQRQLITEYYEKARYSNHECNKKEVRQMKQLLK